jgi:hypothetical protein
LKFSFEIKKEYIHFKITGEYEKSKDFEKLKEFCDITKQHKCSKILIDIRGFNYILNAFERFDLSEYWVEICRDSGYIKTAILGLEEKMDKLSENVINNRGFEFRLFTDEKEAVNWLGPSQIKKI